MIMWLRNLLGCLFGGVSISVLKHDCASVVLSQ